MSEVHDLINLERRKRGINTVYWSREMTRLAQSQANYCAKVGHLTHSNRYAFQGGENLAGGPGNLSPRTIVNIWLRSKKGHREYLLSPRVRKAGVGTSKSRGYTYAAWAFSDKPPTYPDCPYYKPPRPRPKTARIKVKTHSRAKQLLLVLLAIAGLTDALRRVYLLFIHRGNPTLDIMIFAVEIALSILLIKYARRW
jgi:hypothetical protein